MQKAATPAILLIAALMAASCTPEQRLIAAQIIDGKLVLTRPGHVGLFWNKPCLSYLDISDGPRRVWLIARAQNQNCRSAPGLPLTYAATPTHFVSMVKPEPLERGRVYFVSGKDQHVGGFYSSAFKISKDGRSVSSYEWFDPVAQEAMQGVSFGPPGGP